MHRDHKTISTIPYASYPVQMLGKTLEFRYNMFIHLCSDTFSILTPAAIVIVKGCNLYSSSCYFLMGYIS